MNVLSKFFGFLADLINNAERGIVDFISAFVPYAVPIIPAYLTYYHTLDMMDFPAWVAWTAAFVVEALGLASVSTAVRFYLHNKRYKSEQNKAPLWMAIVVYVFYIAIVIVVNVMLEVVSAQRSGAIIWAIALFSFLSFPSGVLISVRTQYREMLEEKAERKQQAQQSVNQPKAEKHENKPKPASAHKEKILESLDVEYKKSGRVLSPVEITARLKIDHKNNKGYVSGLTSTWMQEKGIAKEKPNRKNNFGF